MDLVNRIETWGAGPLQLVYSRGLPGHRRDGQGRGSVAGVKFCGTSAVVTPASDKLRLHALPFNLAYAYLRPRMPEDRFSEFTCDGVRSWASGAFCARSVD
jgi:hypothetical protein